jgi:hypothetical protein
VSSTKSNEAQVILSRRFEPLSQDFPSQPSWGKENMSPNEPHGILLGLFDVAKHSLDFTLERIACDEKKYGLIKVSRFLLCTLVSLRMLNFLTLKILYGNLGHLLFGRVLKMSDLFENRERSEYRCCLRDDLDFRFCGK